MTDREIFKAELDRLKEETYIGLSEHENGVKQGRMEVINSLYKTLHHMQEEPVSEDLENEIEKMWAQESKYRDTDYTIAELTKQDYEDCARHFSQWQKEQMMKEAIDGEYLDNNIILEGSIRGMYDDGDKVKLIIIKDK